MDVVGSEIGQKMRSAIKAKLTELGCYVDDELPDYVMVMVANKRTRGQMEDDLQLFLGDNTTLFVNWLHQVLKKLQEVTVAAPVKQLVEPIQAVVPRVRCDNGETAEPEKIKEKTKDKKSKEKKDKSKDKVKKTGIDKKNKKKDKEKSHKKKDKESKKGHKSKKKSKHHEIKRPNIPPLLMNMEKESEPSITDVFAGQILKNHGIAIETPKEEKQIDKKPIVNEIKRPILPIIDPATISSQPEPPITEPAPLPADESEARTSVSSMGAPREEQIKEMNEIETKIQGLKQKLAEQLDSMSDDEDFLNIRTEAEDLMNDFAEDVFQEISSQAEAPVVATPPIVAKKSPSPIKDTSKPPEPPKEIPKEPSIEPEEPPKNPPIDLPETLPQIELKLPKRPIRERLGAKQAVKGPETKPKETEKRKKSPERLTPDKELDFWGKNRPTRSRRAVPERKPSTSDSSDNGDARKVTSKVSVSERVATSTAGRCASVVRVRPRARVAPASGLLLRAVADAHKSLLNIPPKPEQEPSKIKRGIVLPMRRCVDAQKIVIQVPRNNSLRRTTTNVVSVDSDDEKSDKQRGEMDAEKSPPLSLSARFQSTAPAPRPERAASRHDDTLIIEAINIHNPTVDKDKDTQFIVTMDGFNPNSFLTKKLMTEGILNEEEEPKKKSEVTLEKSGKITKSVLKIEKTVDNIKEAVKEKPVEKDKSKTAEKDEVKKDRKDKSESPELRREEMEKTPEVEDKGELRTRSVEKKRLSNTSDESDTQVIINPEETKTEKRKNVQAKSCDSTEDTPPSKKRRASPIVFDVEKKEKSIEPTKERERKPVKERERTESASSDNQVTVTTAVSAHKYDTVPPLSAAEKKLVPCRWFPLCRFGAACAYQHPRCKFAAACTRRNCIYLHAPETVAPVAVVASHVVPTPNFKSISAAAAPGVCRFYPACVNPACHFYHPKPCRYGAACGNKLDCNFYHADVPFSKWRYPV